MTNRDVEDQPSARVNDHKIPVFVASMKSLWCSWAYFLKECWIHIVSRRIPQLLK